MMSGDAPERFDHSRVDVSVVISTYNRCDRLRSAIESVLTQELSTPPFEVIVVDNNSTDATRRVVEELMKINANLSYVFEREQGVSHGRNTGIRRARASIIAFTDDDVRVAGNWVSSIVTFFAANSEIDFVGGKVLPEWPSPPPAWLTMVHWAPLALTDLGEEPFLVNRRRPLCLVSANLAVRRRAFEAVGLFDPSFQHRPGAVSSGEDHDLELRLWRDGRQGMYLPTMIVTADVQLNRLHKRYHRRWHRDHGALATRLLLPNECYDADGSLTTAPPGGASLFGVPAWAFRALLTTLKRFIAAVFARPRDRSFEYEGSLREQLAAMQAQYETFRRARNAGRLALAAHVVDAMRFVKTIVTRRHTRSSS